MTVADVYKCRDHGFFESPSCEICNSSCQKILSADERRDLSGFMSWALRHDPDAAGITVDNQGWAEISDLQSSAEDDNHPSSYEAIKCVVSMDSKGRFEISGNSIRANYGHSIDVSVDGESDDVPSVLFHGTPEENVESIFEDGLRPMGREQVHLTDEISEARSVGERHSNDVIVLEIDSESLQNNQTIEKRGEHIYTTRSVDPKYITRRS